jgi:hypothetical protein
VTSSVRLPLATTVCGGSTCTLFRPPDRESSADWPRSAEISRVPVQRMGLADSAGCAGSTQRRSRRETLASWPRTSICRDSRSTRITRPQYTLWHSARSGRQSHIASHTKSVDNFSTSGNLLALRSIPTIRMRDSPRQVVATLSKFISRLRLTTRSGSVASPLLSVCFRTRPSRCCPPSVQQSLHTGFPASGPSQRPGSRVADRLVLTQSSTIPAGPSQLDVGGVLRVSMGR